MDQALVKDAEDDVDGDDRSEDQVRLVFERLLKGLCRSLECGVNGRGMPISAWAFCRAVTASPRATFGARLKVSVTAGYWPW